MKLALGTAQLGLDYGIANTAGKVSAPEAQAIISCARESGIEVLDTAVAYGDSEARLGDLGVDGFDVVSKLPAIPDDVLDVAAWATDLVRQSLALLRTERLYGLLLHRPLQLTEARGSGILEAFSRLKADGLVLKTGVSIHNPADLDALYPVYRPDIVQAPFSLFDARLLESGWMQRLSHDGVELHVRSIFLQGVLLIPPAQRPERFDRWADHFAAYDSWLEAHGRSATEACVSYAMSLGEIARIVVGVDTAEQLRGIVAALAAPAPDFPESLRSSDADLLNPLVWMRR